MQKKSKTNKNINNQKNKIKYYLTIHQYGMLDNYFFRNTLYDIENNKSDNNNKEHIFKLLLNK